MGKRFPVEQKATTTCHSALSDWKSVIGGDPQGSAFGDIYLYYL